jgi:hypothetical protein
MATLSKVTQSATQTVLVFGPPKSGKTQLVGQLATKYKLIWFDLENGSATLFKLPIEAQERVELIKLPDSRSFPIAIETCLKVIKGGPVIIDEATGKVVPKKVEGKQYVDLHLNALTPDTIVVFDSLTQLTNSAISHITKSRSDDYKMQYDDWGHLGKLMDIFLSHVQAAPFNVVCISHEAEVEMEDGKMKIVPVAGSRAFSRNSAKFFGHVVYSQVQLKAHKFTSTTTAMPHTIAGSRLDVATEKMDEPSLIPIFESGIKTNQSNGQIAAAQLKKLARK